MGLFSWFKPALDLGYLRSQVVNLGLELDKVKPRLLEIEKKLDEAHHRIDQLEAKVDSAKDHQPVSNFTYHANLLWLPDDPEPFCPRCREVDGKAVHMFLDYDYAGTVKNHRYCPQCKYQTSDVKSPFS